MALDRVVVSEAVADGTPMKADAMRAAELRNEALLECGRYAGLFVARE